MGGAGLGYNGGGNFLVGTDYVGLRGYDDPNAAYAIPTAQANQAGGIAFNKYVLEMRYPVSLNPAATVYVLAFAEAGNAFDSYNNYNPYKLYRSAGVGARIFMSAFGLLGFDYGHGFDYGGAAAWQTLASRTPTTSTSSSASKFASRALARQHFTFPRL